MRVAIVHHPVTFYYNYIYFVRKLIADIPVPFCNLQSFELLVTHEEHMREEDVFKVMREFLSLCKRHHSDLNQILIFEDIYKNEVIDYLKGVFYSKDPHDLQNLLDGLRKEMANDIGGMQDSSTEQTFTLLKEVQTHTFTLASLRNLGTLCKEDKKVDQRFQKLTIQRIHEIVGSVTKVTKGKTIIFKGNYMSLREVLMEVEQVSEVHIVAEHCLRVDTDLTLPGVNLLVASPDIKIMCPVKWDVRINSQFQFSAALSWISLSHSDLLTCWLVKRCF